MDRVVLHNYRRTASSLSITSLADGSEPISEAEEILEVKSLHEKGRKAASCDDYRQAIRCFSEALEIDEKNTSCLRNRAAAYLKLDNYLAAKKDTDVAIMLNSRNANAHLLNGVALKYLNKPREALSAFLTALDLDSEHADKACHQIMLVAAQFCQINADAMDYIKEMDAYKKLCEVGVCLYNNKKYALSLQILETAEKFKTNQQGITMRILLTMANAHSALKNSDQAISLYQDCLGIAVSSHDHLYQTKSLVNIATLYLEIKEMHLAILYYERLLDLQNHLRIESAKLDRDLPEFWTKDLQCGLHLNLSIAYKSIGQMAEAVKHAQKYIQLLERFRLKGRIKAESFHNIGMLNEILGNFGEALENYQKYYKECRQHSLKKGIAQAYGCLGSVYTAMRNWPLAISYYEQYISIAKRADDTKLLILAYNMLGDMYMQKADHSLALKYFKDLLAICGRTDYRNQAIALCKLGHANKGLEKHQFALYFYQEALDLARDVEYSDIQMMCEYNVAKINQYSSQVKDIEIAWSYFDKLIAFLERKINQHRVEDTVCTENYKDQLVECYDGIQCAFIKLGQQDRGLSYAESFRRWQFAKALNYGLDPLHSEQAKTMTCSLEKLTRVVSQQNATVMYYSLLPKQLLLWVLTPSEGLVQFYASPLEGVHMRKQIQELLECFRHGYSEATMLLECERRALPINDHNHTAIPASKPCKPDRNDESMSGVESPVKFQTKTDFRKKLFDILIFPVNDVLLKQDNGSSLVIIPDKDLSACPFTELQDFHGRSLRDRFAISYMASLQTLEQAVSNEINWFQKISEIDNERSLSRNGGISKYLPEVNCASQISRMNYVISDMNSTVSTVDSGMLNVRVDPKRTSNPKLLNTLGIRAMQNNQQQAMMLMNGKSSEYLSFIPNVSRIDSITTFVKNGLQSPVKGRPTVTPANSPIRLRSKFTSSPKKKFSSSHVFPSSLAEGNTVDNQSPPLLNVIAVKSLVVSESLERQLATDTFSRLTSNTSTGTDIVTSNQVITEFRQVSGREKALVIGCPELPEILPLHGKPWKPGEPLLRSKRELLLVGKYLDVTPITGPEATKSRFLQEIQLATIIHIASYGCSQTNCIVMSPNSSDAIAGSDITEHSYIITIDDIVNLKINAQLVVLSCYGNPSSVDPHCYGYMLPSAFIAAGCQCVLVTQWSVSNNALDKFYFNFYTRLQKGALLSAACNAGIHALQEDDRFSDIFFWSSFCLVGKDVMVDISSVRQSMLDQLLNHTEVAVQEELGVGLLNPIAKPSNVLSREEKLDQLQKLLCEILSNHSNQKDIIHHLMLLLDDSLKRLHSSEKSQSMTALDTMLIKSNPAIALLQVLGFHFQGHGAKLDKPSIVFPHNNVDDLLMPLHDALSSLTEITACESCMEALLILLPMSQNLISQVIDLLCLTKHATEIHLRVTDTSVRCIWQDITVKPLLVAIGYHQIGTLVNFRSTPQNTTLLTALLQFLISLSTQKSSVLLYKLDVSMLGQQPSPERLPSPELSRLPTLAPLLLPTNQVRMATPWMSCLEEPEEMKEKLELIKSTTDLRGDFRQEMERAKTWHQMSLTEQAQESLDKVGRPKTMTPLKVKVIPGSSSSRIRTPIVQEPVLTIHDAAQRRDYAHFILNKRVTDIGARHHKETQKMYLPYLQNVVK